MSRESKQGDDGSEEYLLSNSTHYEDSEDPESPYLPASKRLRTRSLLSPAPGEKRRWLLLGCAALSALSLFSLGFVFLTTRSKAPEVLDIPVESVSSNTSTSVHESFVLGPPTQSFRDNLRNDTKYITSWISAGWKRAFPELIAELVANDVMTYGNLLYLALITDRVPIIAKFIPSHIGGSVPPIAFGEVFDVPRLSKAIGAPVLEWHEVKDVDSQNLDDLGCWNVWEAVQKDEHQPRYSFLSHWLKLDISYTRAPNWIQLTPPEVEDKHASFWSLAQLGFPQGRSENLQPPSLSPEHQLSLPPDEQLLCFDYLYYVSASKAWEWELDYSPAWRSVGQHMRWTDRLMKMSDEYLRRAMSIAEDEATPPFISIHIRHGDFRNYCNDIPLDQCFASIPIIARRVAEVQEDLRQRKGLNVTRVMMTSDERDPAWWDEVRAQGWSWVDYTAERTEEIYGKWYPVLIDAVIQSSGAGFVGTYGSTMTTLARRRVESWHDGPIRVVRWGWPGADDH
ncbi:hypothetical protein BV22DRAFT_1045518 [Leucogyrophana mollusca]|uniref:Uncharacterized protein n=1 Tax=Leucogyrophana mollusca TaxID=85980 RepID=A0ACB8BRQ9_9AGAM|nr:hypothetical protein BV22DRAFT_1045518 [Leucogyrophana mollusca]